MQKITKTVYLSDDGEEYATEEQARIADLGHTLTVAFDATGKHWDEVNLQDLAMVLYREGYTLVSSSPTPA